MAYNIPNRTIAEQVHLMKARFPQFITEYTSHYSMKVLGMLQPTSRSVTYNFVLNYNINKPPQTKIISPKLQKKSNNEDIPHIYSGQYLCLYQPKYFEFRRSDLICETIIPWTSLWLYHYEVWHLTGEWLGGGEHPVKLKLNMNEKAR